MKPLLLRILMLLVVHLSFSQVTPLERAALVELYDSTDGPNWSSNTNWNTATTVDNWQGITVFGGHVIEIDIQGNNLVGNLPIELGDLQWLQIFNLARNKISGPIPDEIYTIISLETIALQSNRTLDGIISPNIGNLVNLKTYSLHENKITGPIPIEITTLPNLESLSLYKNNLTGTIIPELGNLTTLKALRIGDNDYSPGIIPPELGNLTNLTSLTIDKSNLIGTLPPELGNLLLLSVFYIQTNALTGPIPPEYGNFTEARSFLWSDNQLTGSIPSVLENWTKCKNFYVGNNQLSGPIPPELGNMTAMEQLNLGNNMLDGAIPSTLGNLSKVSHLVFSGNQLTGSIPASLTGLTELYQLHVSNNQLSGIIPDFTPLTGLGFDSKSVEFLWIDGNQYQFGDFENEFATYKANMTSLDVSPQAKLDLPLVLNENTGDDVTLSVTVPNGTQLHYTWYKNNSVIAGALDSPTFTILNAQTSDAGIYRCDVTSDIVTDLTLQRHDIALTVSAAAAFKPFITTWKTDNTTWDPTIVNITTDPTENYDYTIDWGDGNIENNIKGNATHDYGATGTYTISISGLFPRILFDLVYDRFKIVSIEQWGDIEWSSMELAFSDCRFMEVNATDIPDLSNVTSLRAMFRSCRIMTGTTTFSNWDVSQVTDMGSMFGYCHLFNQDIGGWNVSQVTNMSSMLQDADTFNQDVGNWNVSNVTNMGSLFSLADNFNQDIGNWNVSNVTNMRSMFAATPFNKDIGNWDVSSVTSFKSMFYHAQSFNQDITGWDVSSINDMSRMFDIASNFNQNISSWNISNVTTTEGMFRDATSFDQNIGNWNVTALTNAANMFDNVTLTTSNYDALLIGWNAQNLNQNVSFSGGNSQYCSGRTARENITATDFWNITDGDSASPTVDTSIDITACSSYTLPALSANNNYYSATNEGGTMLNANDLITTSQTIYIYTETTGCSDESSFVVSIITNPTADNINDVEACQSYSLPNLNAGNTYYTESNATGTQLMPGDDITSSQTIYVYTGTAGCSDENSFIITIDTPIVVDTIENIAECESYTLPILANGNYFTDSGGNGTELFTADIISVSQEIFIYFESITCSHEQSFTVTIDSSLCEEEEVLDLCEFPKFFTPNGDGINDLFELSSNDCDLIGELRIYDKYGKLVFQTSNLNRSWDGNLAGFPLPASDYWYQFIDNSSGQLVTKHFSLKR